MSLPTLKINWYPHPGQFQFFQNPARFKICCAGRRWGKSRGCGTYAVRTALRPDKADAMIGWIAPYFKNTLPAWRFLTNTRVFRPPIIKSANKSERRITYYNGASILFSTGDNPDSILGEGYDLVIVDEASRIPDKVWYETIYPALADKRGEAVIISTPRGKGGFFADLWRRGQDRLDRDYKSFHFPSHDNPFLDPTVLENMKRDLPESVYRQEVLAEFLDEGSGVFRNIAENIRGDYTAPAAGPYVIGWDIAKAQDYSVVIVGDMFGRVVDFQRFNQIDYPTQIRRVIETSRRYRNAMIFLDSTGIGDPIADEMARLGAPIYPYQINYQSKKVLIENLQLALERGMLSIPPSAVEVRTELEIYEYEVTGHGNIRYNAPPGRHDDCVISLALYVWGAGIVGGHGLIERGEDQISLLGEVAEFGEYQY